MNTFAELRTYAANQFNIICKTQNDAKKKIEKMSALGIYNPEYLLQCEQEAHDDVQRLAKLYALDLKDAVVEFIQAKKTALDQMLIIPPTPEQVRTLNAIQLQGEGISQMEIDALIPHFANNYQAIHALEAVAKKAGKKFHIPEQYQCDFETLKDKLDRAEEYLNDRVYDLGKYTGDKLRWDIENKSFFGAWEGWEDHFPPVYVELTAPLDSNEQITPKA